ncbi:MAG TPA: hypothetical protein VFQ22_01360, partial [Longimicrobiales bacterium]|nr:hypothetical protein [Longimicrobiales bacterium]
ALIDGEIARLGDDAPPLLELTRLHVLDAAARRDFRGRTAWVQQHVDRLRYFETGGVYRVAQRAYEDLYERHRDAPEADRLAWEYLSRLDPGECEDDASCWLDRVERSYAAYWQRFPEGPYVEEALTRAAEILEIVARYACWTGQDDDTRVPGERVSDLEASVRALDAEGRERVLELVAQIRERCP